MWDLRSRPSKVVELILTQTAVPSPALSSCPLFRNLKISTDTLETWWSCHGCVVYYCVRMLPKLTTWKIPPVIVSGWGNKKDIKQRFYDICDHGVVLAVGRYLSQLILARVGPVVIKAITNHKLAFICKIDINIRMFEFWMLGLKTPTSNGLSLSRL